MFLAKGVRQWGTFDGEKRVIDLHDAAHPNNEDLLDLEAVQTYLNGGTVYVVKPGEVPGGDLLAAVLRYLAMGFSALASHLDKLSQAA
ncbi:MAG: hypothetical protein M3461_04305 [Pseudomonadota bacterium]|nr:hypothetical protein [Pseudomonadota bacterium]